MTMNQEELTKLKKALNGLMASMGAKRLDESAMLFWTLTLKNYPYPDVREALINWAQTQHALPRPNDIVESIKHERVMKVEEQRKAAEEADRAERQADCSKIDVQAFIKKVHDSIDDSEPISVTMQKRARAILAAIEQGKDKVSLFNVIKNGKPEPNEITLLPIHEWWAKRVLGIKD